MIEELNILNGKLDLEFDKYNNIYTVEVEENINKLEFTYKISEGYNISVNNNVLDEDINYVYVNVYNDTDFNTYTFIVNKNISETTSLIDDYKSKIFVKEEKVSKGEVIGIISGCFIILLIVFILLFKKKKIK